MKVLLLNPPGTQTFVRDYYCSKVSKSNYLFQPIDLVIQSGILSEHHEVTVCDSIADRLSAEATLKLIENLGPDIIISLAGSVSLNDDLAFLELAARHCRTLLVSGDAFLDEPQNWLTQQPFIGGILLDFTSDDVLAFINGDVRNSPSIVTPGSRSVYHRPRNQEFSIPVPLHEKFTSPNYRFPFVRQRKFATVLTDFGCPYRCSFCVMATLGYRYRPVANVMEELRHVKGLGIRELFFFDQSFGIQRERAMELCENMQREGLKFGWVCFSRVDLIDQELLTVMKKAGCHTIIFGVESASELILERYRKGYTKQDILKAFRLCRASGIRTVATFILGLPEETRQTAMETIDFLKYIDCDFASFNIAVPRAGTELRQNAIQEGLISNSMTVMDQSGTAIAMASHHLTPGEIGKLKHLALRTFYLRPSYLLRRLTSIRSWYELKEQIREGLHLLWDH
jgi:anaerobic magnesium-protoporphyrin IX monomethyl ester cyclase